MQELTPTSPTPSDLRRLTFGLLLSLTFHALLLNLSFGGQGLGLPGLALPWQDRRTEVPDMHVVPLPTPRPAAVSLLGASVEPPDKLEPKMLTLLSADASKSLANPEQALPEDVAKTKTIAASPYVPAISPLPVERPIEKMAAPPQPTKEVIAMAKPDQPTWSVPPAPELPAAVAAPPLASDAKQDAQRQAEQLEAERQIAAQQEATRLEAARVEAARAQAVRIEAAKIEAERQDLAKQAAAKQEAARQAAIQIEAARLAAIQAEAEQRQEKLRAIGRQLNEEAARRAAALLSGSSARRGRLFGRSDANAELILYAETMSRKIQMNTTIDTVRELAKLPHTDPMVAVAK